MNELRCGKNVSCIWKFVLLAASSLHIYHDINTPFFGYVIAYSCHEPRLITTLIKTGWERVRA